MTFTVADLKKGECGTILKLNDLHNTCKLLTLGLMPKARVEMIRKSPFGDAIYLKVNQNLVAIRIGEAQNIELE